MILNFSWQRWSSMKTIVRKKPRWSFDWSIFTTKSWLKESGGSSLSSAENCLTSRNRFDWTRRELKRRKRFSTWWKFLPDSAILKSTKSWLKESLRKNRSGQGLKNLRNWRKKDSNLLLTWMKSWREKRRRMKRRKRTQFSWQLIGTNRLHQFSQTKNQKKNSAFRKVNKSLLFQVPKSNSYVLATIYQYLNTRQ